MAKRVTSFPRAIRRRLPTAWPCSWSTRSCDTRLALTAADEWRDSSPGIASAPPSNIFIAKSLSPKRQRGLLRSIGHPRCLPANAWRIAMPRTGPPIPAVFLDKDGTLIDDVPYNVDPRRIELAQGAAEGAAVLSEAGYALVVVSNQSGVARGIFTEDALPAVEHRIRELLANFDVPLAGFYYCPHHPLGSIPRYAAQCSCRKPQPGMILQAAKELRLDLAESWLIGDILDDIEAGHRAGCRT